MSSSGKFSGLSVDDTAETLKTSKTAGLDEPEAALRRRHYGFNVLHDDEEKSILRQFAAQFLENPLILMLIASAIVSVFLGNVDDAISITVAIVFVVGVGFIQEYRSEQSIKALTTLMPPSAHLTRSGARRTVLADQLVPGDVVNLTVGDRVPADVRLVSAVHLMIDESSLTGETTPVEKSTDPVNGGGILDRHNIAFMGTLVTAGRGHGIVVGTGHDTEFGQIFAMMNEIDKPKTPLQQSMDKLGHELSMVSFGVIGVICLIGVIQGRKWLEMFQIGVSLAVAAIPEGLPIIVTVTLALGVLRMARSNAIVRRLPSVETLGSVNVICSDKTGTLTLNQLQVAGVYGPTNSEWTDLRKLRSNESLPSVNSKLLDAAVFCNDAQKMANGEFSGNPVDCALLELGEKFKHEDRREQAEYARAKEIPFSSERKWMAVSLKNGTTYVKGALEKLLPLSTHFVSSNGTPELSNSVRSSLEDASIKMAEHGMRILALASREGTVKSDHEDEVQDLTICGLVAMYDPPRPGVANSVQRLRESGVKVVMITGDNEVTAIAAAREVGIPVPANSDQYVILGSTLENLTAEQLSESVDNVLVFARTSPEMKVTIVRSLQMRGNIVAMTGDGVNDAPALKLADIGVSMGSGTDVAKEVSDMILVNDDFSTILQAIREGKAIFTNIKSFLTFQLSTSVAALSLIVCSTVLKLPTPLNAMQVLWINILMDGPPAQSLGVEAADPEEMRKPPRSREDHVLEKRIVQSVLWRGVVILCGTMYVYIREMQDQQVTARDTTMSFTAFVLFDLFNALSSRSSNRSIFQIGVFSNKMFNLAVGLSLLGQLAVIYVPLFQQIFQTEAVSFRDILYLCALASTILWVDEVWKYLRRRKAPQVRIPLQSFV